MRSVLTIVLLLLVGCASNSVETIPQDIVGVWEWTHKSHLVTLNLSPDGRFVCTLDEPITITKRDDNTGALYNRQSRHQSKCSGYYGASEQTIRFRFAGAQQGAEVFLQRMLSSKRTVCTWSMRGKDLVLNSDDRTSSMKFSRKRAAQSGAPD